MNELDQRLTHAIDQIRDPVQREQVQRDAIALYRRLTAEITVVSMGMMQELIEDIRSKPRPSGWRQAARGPI